ncbi:AfsR/SARP family transcriptional regulator [Pseudonocardia sp. TRM90224]|uniref:AfsR/SARP family transcriptional regulator n=1 Tax=Pseudonocardia sp. TRM90224 TaxID=2812678 RepID=UPI001E440659|nr:AfsR/SARP family transcriptional regulator [Pseudonocardia sp. TRM90224]
MTLGITVLGPTVIRAAGLRIDLARSMERALLVRLAVAGGHPVLDGDLHRDLWTRPGRSEPARLRVLVSRTRASLGPHGHHLERACGGYRLAGEATDLCSVRTLTRYADAAARHGRPDEVVAATTAALDHWTGPALADLRTFPFAEAEGRRLDEHHLDLTIRRLDAQLHLDAAQAPVGELGALATRHPQHEHIRSLLAHALYRAGRQADALHELAQLRRHLAETLGLDPTPSVAAMEVRMLRHDPTLAAASVRRAG